MQPVITLNNVRKSYPGFALEIPHLEIAAGYITGFIGQNGAGKTTTLRMIMDILEPDSGEITVLGGNMKTDAEAIKQDIGYVDSLAYFSQNFRVGRAKAVIAPFYKNWDEELYQRYVKRFDIQEKKKLKDLSTGQSKLFSLVMALCHHPKLLILDEPTSGLDPVIRNELLDILAEQLQGGDVSVFFSTHITSDLDKTADYIAYIQDGKLVLHEEKDRMLEQYRIVKGDVAQLQGVAELLTGIKVTSVGFTALTRDAAAVVQRLGDAVMLEKPTLEDIMVYNAKEKEGGLSA